MPILICMRFSRLHFDVTSSCSFQSLAFVRKELKSTKWTSQTIPTPFHWIKFHLEDRKIQIIITDDQKVIQMKDFYWILRTATENWRMFMFKSIDTLFSWKLYSNWLFHVIENSLFRRKSSMAVLNVDATIISFVHSLCH